MGDGLWQLVTDDSDEWREEVERSVEIHKNFFEKYGVYMNDIVRLLEYLMEIYPESMISDMWGTGWKKEDEDNIKRDIEDAVRWMRNKHEIDKWIKLHKSLYERSMRYQNGII